MRFVAEAPLHLVPQLFPTFFLSWGHIFLRGTWGLGDYEWRREYDKMGMFIARLTRLTQSPTRVFTPYRSSIIDYRLSPERSVIEFFPIKPPPCPSTRPIATAGVVGAAAAAVNVVETRADSKARRCHHSLYSTGAAGLDRWLTFREIPDGDNTRPTKTRPSGRGLIDIHFDFWARASKLLLKDTDEGEAIPTRKHDLRNTVGHSVDGEPGPRIIPAHNGSVLIFTVSTIEQESRLGTEDYLIPGRPGQLGPICGEPRNDQDSQEGKDLVPLFTLGKTRSSRSRRYPSLRSKFKLYEIDVQIFFPYTMYIPGYERGSLTKPKITLKLEESDPGLVAIQAAHGMLNDVYWFCNFGGE
ncbi:hypothetical protein BDM02DRAFT_3259134 [Thelephora ganbajun]|uniref:Uncharacterized protein n=1 Tax=Thelephora ganbajun TaxID=370292 RepID=A0ACB6ZPJ2_THEGA|nr:hypothetical protein BDM02DRAFT_3259134 [Thelephora ganbajun]